MIAADGKEIYNVGKKNSGDPAERRNLNEFNAMSTELGINLSSTRIDEKSNEIPKMQNVMRQLDCSGCVVTADAMNTQKATAKAIIDEAHGDYYLALKENQKRAYIEVYFACEKLLKELLSQEGRYFKETEETSCAAITREYFVTDDIKWFEDKKGWRKLTSIRYEKKTIGQKETGEASVENGIICAVSSLLRSYLQSSCAGTGILKMACIGCLISYSKKRNSAQKRKMGYTTLD